MEVTAPMARQAVRVGRVPIDDDQVVEQFSQLWIQSRVASGHSDQWARRTVGDGALRTVLERDDVRVYLAVAGDDAVGFAVALDGPLSTLAEHAAVWIEQLFVVEHRRGSGVAKALLGRIARDAQSAGVGQLVSCVPSHAKDLNRYFARLGFAPSVTERTISPCNLLRHLAGDDAQSPAMEIVRKRRSMRARARARIKMAHTGS